MCLCVLCVVCCVCVGAHANGGQRSLDCPPPNTQSQVFMLELQLTSLAKWLFLGIQARHANMALGI